MPMSDETELPVFRPGQRVRLSAYAKERGIRLQRRAGDMGIVVRVSRLTRRYIDVRPDNYRKPQGYYAGFWEPIDE